MSEDTVLPRNLSGHARVADRLADGSLTGSLTGGTTGALMGSLTGRLMGSRASGACGVADSDALVKWLGNEVCDCSRGLIPRKIDLLRRGDVPLRGGVFGVQKTPSHKP